jgi:hypothetical protein
MLKNIQEIIQLIILKRHFIIPCTATSTGSDMIQSYTVHENDINSDDMNRIRFDTDSSDGLTSRYVHAFYSLTNKL